MRVLAVDLGATSCKVFSVSFEDGKLDLEEVDRFKVPVVKLPNSSGTDLFWDLPAAFERIHRTVLGSDVESVSIDSWGVDFGLIDRNGRLVSFPHHYRDDRTIGIMEKFFEKIHKRRIYDITGSQFMRINTLYQLYSMVLENDPRLGISDTMLMIADLIMYWLSGEKFAEYTLASTTQMMDIREKTWSEEIVQVLGVENILPEVVDSGTVVGRVRGSDIRAVAGTSHDTAAAVLSVPFEEPGIFISSGTWSLIGVELEEPLISDESYSLNFANEGAFGGRVKFLKNTTGMWILEECNSEWRWDYSDLIEGAKGEEVEAFFDPDDPEFIPPGNMVGRLKEHLRIRGQEVPDTIEGMARVVFENAVFNYAWVVEKMEEILEKRYGVIHVVGGGSRNDLVNQLLSNVTGKVVRVGPVEATVIGNALAQLIALGFFKDSKEAREVVKKSFDISVYEPRDTDHWKGKFEKWKEVVGKG